MEIQNFFSCYVDNIRIRTKAFNEKGQLKVTLM